MGTTPTLSRKTDTQESEEGRVLVPAQTGLQGPGAPLVSVGSDLADEIRRFRDECSRHYRFNSRWDNVLNVMGILLSVGIVASGVYQLGALSAILGAFVAAIVSAQKAFPFGQRTNFYRILMGQSSNLETDVEQNVVAKESAIAILKSLRLDLAQQLPRGSTFNSTDIQRSSPSVTS
jgi:hypothetical protein